MLFFNKQIIDIVNPYCFNIETNEFGKYYGYGTVKYLINKQKETNKKKS